MQIRKRKCILNPNQAHAAEQASPSLRVQALRQRHIEPNRSNDSRRDARKKTPERPGLCERQGVRRAAPCERPTLQNHPQQRAGRVLQWLECHFAWHQRKAKQCRVNSGSSQHATSSDCPSNLHELAEPCLSRNHTLVAPGSSQSQWNEPTARSAVHIAYA